MNWKGRGGKTAFCHMELCKVIKSKSKTAGGAWFDYLQLANSRNYSFCQSVYNVVFCCNYINWQWHDFLIGNISLNYVNYSSFCLNLCSGVELCNAGSLYEALLVREGVLVVDDFSKMEVDAVVSAISTCWLHCLLAICTCAPFWFFCVFYFVFVVLHARLFIINILSLVIARFNDLVTN